MDILPVFRNAHKVVVYLSQDIVGEVVAIDGTIAKFVEDVLDLGS